MPNRSYGIDMYFGKALTWEFYPKSPAIDCYFSFHSLSFSSEVQRVSTVTFERNQMIPKATSPVRDSVAPGFESYGFLWKIR